MAKVKKKKLKAKKARVWWFLQWPGGHWSNPFDSELEARVFRDFSAIASSDNCRGRIIKVKEVLK